mmetsp:Transcript_6875/g.6173  ORF Transcript_6875/g.6173 Transcript_6875/m.6173 type:complete len:87 (-) Transcript_6875:148-408(-)
MRICLLEPDIYILMAYYIIFGDLIARNIVFSDIGFGLGLHSGLPLGCWLYVTECIDLGYFERFDFLDVVFFCVVGAATAGKTFDKK